MATPSALTKLKQHFGHNFLIGRITHISEEGDYGLITAVQEYTGQELKYPDGQPVNDVLFVLNGSKEQYHLFDWVWIHKYELANGSSPADRPVRLTATEVEPLPQVAIIRQLLEDERNKITEEVVVERDRLIILASELDSRQEAVEQERSTLKTEQEALQEAQKAFQARLDPYGLTEKRVKSGKIKLSDDLVEILLEQTKIRNRLKKEKLAELAEREKVVEIEEQRLKEWNARLERESSDLNSRLEKLYEDEKRLEEKKKALEQDNMTVLKYHLELDARLSQYRLTEENIATGDIELSDELIELLWQQAGIRDHLREEKLPELLRLDLEKRQQEINLYEQQVNQSLLRWGFEPISTNGHEASEPAEPVQHANEQELLAHVAVYIAAQGFNFPWNNLVNFYTCLKTGALTILAGLSGTGKSSLVRLFGEAVGAKFMLVPVKATWGDDTDLIGFYHPVEKTYVSTPFLDALVEARACPDRLFLICLDEMNLSRVEYYFSNFLSVLEQGDYRKLDLYSEHEWRLSKAALELDRQKLGSGQISEIEYNAKERSLHAYSHRIDIPGNVFICGTVNVDETTKPFSDKVLDRAQIIQFEHVGFGEDEEIARDASVVPASLSYQQFVDYRVKADIPFDHAWFNQLNDLLRIGGFHFGHRVKKQMEDYCGYASHSQLFKDLTDEDLMDIQIVQKVLPKIRGLKTESIQNDMFPQLEAFCRGHYPQALNKLRAMSKMESINYWQVFGNEPQR